jgi:uncharacterized membrane protein
MKKIIDTGIIILYTCMDKESTRTTNLKPMNTKKLKFFKNWSVIIPERYDQEFKKNIGAINLFRTKIFCLGTICLGFFLFLIDSKMINAQGQSGFHHYYLWSDAILFGLGLFFYLLLRGVQNDQEEKQSVQQILILLATFVLLSWGLRSSADCSPGYCISTKSKFL